MVGLFTARLAGWDGGDRIFGAVALLIVVPVTYLLLRALGERRRLLYFIWIAVILLFQAVELLLDYVFAVDFRQNTAIVIPYVMLFFAAMGASDRPGVAGRKSMGDGHRAAFPCGRGADFRLARRHRHLSRSALFVDDADEGQLAEGLLDVHAIADDEFVGADEADEIGLDRPLTLARLLA